MSIKQTEFDFSIQVSTNQGPLTMDLCSKYRDSVSIVSGSERLDVECVFNSTTNKGGFSFFHREEWKNFRWGASPYAICLLEGASKWQTNVRQGG